MRNKSRTEGRKDRQLGVQLAQLALESLEGIAETGSSEKHRNLLAHGWTWLGRAYRVALDFLAVHQALRRASEELPPKADLLVRAELLVNKACLSWAQRCYEDALAFANGALPLFRNLGNTGFLVEALVLHSNIVRKARSVEAALPDLIEAQELVGRWAAADQQLVLAIHSSLADLQTSAGNYRAAARTIATARADAREDATNEFSLALLQAQEGRIALGENRLLEAIDVLEQARERFVSL